MAIGIPPQKPVDYYEQSGDTLDGRYKPISSEVCHQYYFANRQPPFICQVVLPRDFTGAEAARICAFIRTLAIDFMPDEEPK